MSSISLICFICLNVFQGNTYKYILTGIDVASRNKAAKPLRTQKSQAKLHLCWKQSIRRLACLNISRRFNVIMGMSLKMKWQSRLKNKMLIFEGREQNTSIPRKSLWKPLKKSWKNQDRSVQEAGNCVLYYLQDWHDRAFVREELMHVSEDTQIPPD